jgi:hypothetical protein
MASGAIVKQVYEFQRVDSKRPDIEINGYKSVSKLIPTDGQVLIID